MNIFDEWDQIPLKLKTEMILRVFAEHLKASSLILARISEITDRMEEKEHHLVQLINKMEVLGWETAIRNEMERKQREEGWKKPTTKKQLRRSS